MWRALVWHNLYGRETVRHELKNGLKTQKIAYFACFRPYVGQPHGHIGWAKPMPLASFNPTNPRTNPWNFGRICSAFDEVEKLSFFESAILNFFFEKKFFFLLHSHKNQPKFIWKNGWVEILMFSLVSRKFLAMRHIALYSVCLFVGDKNVIQILVPTVQCNANVYSRRHPSL